MSKSGWCVEKSEVGKGAEANRGSGKSDFWSKIGRGSGNVMCKGPEVQVCLAHQEAMVPEAEETRGRQRS